MICFAMKYLGNSPRISIGGQPDLVKRFVHVAIETHPMDKKSKRIYISRKCFSIKYIDHDIQRTRNEAYFGLSKKQDTRQAITAHHSNTEKCKLL